MWPVGRSPALPGCGLHDEQMDDPEPVVTDEALWEMIEDYVWMLVIAERLHETTEPWEDLDLGSDSD